MKVENPMQVQNPEVQLQSVPKGEVVWWNNQLWLKAPGAGQIVRLTNGDIEEVAGSNLVIVLPYKAVPE